MSASIAPSIDPGPPTLTECADPSRSQRQPRSARSVGRGVAFNALDSVLAFATGTISGILVPRLLGPQRMGIYSLVLGWFGVASIVAALGLPQACLKFVA